MLRTMLLNGNIIYQKKYKAKGKRLSIKLKQDCFNSIITVYDNGETREVMVL